MITARSRHHCDCCTGPIRVGEKYLHVRYRCDICELCKNIADEMSEKTRLVFKWGKSSCDDLSRYVEEVVCSGCEKNNGCVKNALFCDKVRKRYPGENEMEDGK